MNDASYEPVGERPNKFPWGCLLGGCLTVFVLMVGGVVATGLAGYWFLSSQVAKYTSETPKELPMVELSADELQELEQRVEVFQDQIESGETPDQLILTADDINALISQDEQLKGKVYVTIGDGQVSAEVSIPTDMIPGAQGRFFNGSVTVDAALDDGVLIVTLQDAEVNGEAVPENIMQGFRRENLAKDLYKDPESARVLAKFESLVIQDDQIILTPKPQSETGAGDTSEDGESENAEESQDQRQPNQDSGAEEPTTVPEVTSNAFPGV